MSQQTESKWLRVQRAAVILGAALCAVGGIQQVGGPMAAVAWALRNGAIGLAVGWALYALFHKVFRTLPLRPLPSGRGLRFVIGTGKRLERVRRALHLTAWATDGLAFILGFFLGARFFFGCEIAYVVALLGISVANRVLWADGDAPAITVQGGTLSILGPEGTRFFFLADLIEVSVDRMGDDTNLVIATATIPRFAVAVLGPPAYAFAVADAIVDFKEAADLRANSAYRGAGPTDDAAYSQTVETAQVARG